MAVRMLTSQRSSRVDQEISTLSATATRTGMASWTLGSSSASSTWKVWTAYRAIRTSKTSKKVRGTSLASLDRRRDGCSRGSPWTRARALTCRRPVGGEDFGGGAGLLSAATLVARSAAPTAGDLAVKSARPGGMEEGRWPRKRV